MIGTNFTRISGEQMFYKDKTNRRLAALGLVLFAAGMAAGALWDLALDEWLHSPGSAPAIFMEAFGWYPLYLPPLLWLGTVVWRKSRPGWMRAGAALCGAAAVGVMGYMSLHYLGKRQVAAAWPLLILVWAVMLAGAFALLALARRRGPAFAKKLHFAVWWGTVYMALNNIFINALKLLWNRTRFDDMLAAGDFSAFTSWLHPLGNGGTSFPSGHTAAACSIFVLVLLCDVFPGWHKRRLLVWAACWAYVGGMALSRLVMGRHFLSDTVMAAFVMTVLFLLMTKSKWYKASVARLGAV